MKKLICLLVLLGASSVSAAHSIEVTEPAFTAEKIELNPVTNSYVVVNPKYFVNAKDSIGIVVGGLNGSISVTKTPQHLCTFLGMSGGKVISTINVDDSACNGKTLTITDDGLYGTTRFASSHYDCSVVDFLECNPK